MTKLETARKIEEAADNLMTLGWCTGSLFTPGGQSCALGHILRVCGIDATTWSMALSSSDGRDLYFRDDVIAITIPLAQDIVKYVSSSDYKGRSINHGHPLGSFIFDSPAGVAAADTVWNFNDRSGLTAVEVAELMLATGTRLRKEYYDSVRFHINPDEGFPVYIPTTDDDTPAS